MPSRRILTPHDVKLRVNQRPAAAPRGPVIQDRSLGESTQSPAASSHRGARSDQDIVPAQYMDALGKLIPPEVVAAFLAIDGIVRSSGGAITPGTYWGIFTAVVALTVGYIHLTTKAVDLPPAHRQIVLGTLGFVVWAYCIGGPFDYGATAAFPYNPALGGIVAIVYTLAAPLIAKR